MRKVVVFSGHREVGDGHTALIQQATVRAVEDADEFVFGGAAGADLIAFKAAWQARMAARQACQLSEDQYTAIIQKRGSFPSRLANLRIVCVVAATFDDQPREARSVLEWHRIDPPDIEFVELGMPYAAQGLLHRNRVMIDRISGNEGYLLAYWRDGVYRSGTWSAISYAQKNGVQVVNIL